HRAEDHARRRHGGRAGADRRGVGAEAGSARLSLRVGIVLFTYNEIGNEKDETLAAFLDRMMPVVERSEALVIDLRANPGGNGSFNRVLLHALIRSKQLRQPGRLFV